MEMDGRWVACAATDDVRRFGVGLDYDDADWDEVVVPGHWQQTPAFSTSDGPLMYRHRFVCDPPGDGRRRWITLDGLMYQADTWLDGAYLGDSEGYFFPHSFDVTAFVEDRRRTRAGGRGRLFTPDGRPHQHHRRAADWDGLPHGWNPGGLWRKVRMYDTGSTRIDRLRVLCRDADDRRAHVVLSATFDSDAAPRCHRGHPS